MISENVSQRCFAKSSIEMFKSGTAHMHWDHFEEKGLNWYLNYLKYFFVQLLHNYTDKFLVCVIDNSLIFSFYTLLFKVFDNFL